MPSSSSFLTWVYFELQHHAPHVKKILDDQHSRLCKAQQKILEVERKQENIEDRVEHAVQFHGELEECLQSLRHLPAAHKRSLSKAEREFKSELAPPPSPPPSKPPPPPLATPFVLDHHTAFKTSTIPPQTSLVELLGSEMFGGIYGGHVFFLLCRADARLVGRERKYRFRGVELDALRSSIEAVNARLKRYTHSLQANRSNEERQVSVRRTRHVEENEMSLLKASLEKLSVVNSENAKKVKVVESALKGREIGT
ncbi:hypothetical protein MTR67_030462 [Solanum verrucosum]|uniref:Uncharacterized protein n=1 Tax=Solanum verrucosum TaxID=315347 RepID=A0AAF0R613_SOLVR|nr:hypothetical protein MTR67_030462 [Solanum verrucosum]